MADKFFSSRRITPDTYVITGDGCDCYLLLGEDEALMIDAGQSKKSIRAYAETLTDLPVRRVINTHSHFDHTGGNGYFDVIYGTAATARSAKNTMGGPAEDYPLDYQFTLVSDGDVIDLKGRPLKIVELDCHAPGNIAILDESRRMLFPGDELETGQVLLLPGYAEVNGVPHSKHASSVETYFRAMSRIKDLSDRFDMILPAHNGTPIHKSYLDDYLALAKKIMEGFTGSPDCSSPSYSPAADHYPYANAHYLRAEYHGASLVYCADLIFDSDYDKAESLPVATKCHEQAAKCARQ